MSPPSLAKSPAVLSYLNMRMAVGVLAFIFPFVLILGNIAYSRFGPPGTLPKPLFQISISEYYHTPMRNYLVGTLCAIAVFQICAKGYDLADTIAGHLSGIFAIVTAFAPPTPVDDANPTPLENALGNTHQIVAALMFLTLGYICLVLFRKTSATKKPTRRKLQRNLVYSICGWTMVGCMVVMTSLNIDAVNRFLGPIDPLLTFESIALVAFGTAWLVKGEAILKDQAG